jgi:hypothetical protein
MFAPSATARTPPEMSARASSSSSSFCVAAGIAMSTSTSHGRAPSTNRADGRRAAYAEIRPRSTSLISRSRSTSMPSSSTT